MWLTNRLQVQNENYIRLLKSLLPAGVVDRAMAWDRDSFLFKDDGLPSDQDKVGV
jgi:hypothetical protein